MIERPSQSTLARLDGLLAQPAGHRFGVLGLGVVGRAMVRYLGKRGARVVGADLKTQLAGEPIGRELTALGAELRLGPTSAQTFADVEALALSPGADPRQPAVRAVVERDVPVLGELELCGPLPARVVSITGTNGKSTTTSLAGALAVASGLRAFVGGNLGDPVVAWVDSGEARDVAVLELSSFQLETAWRFVTDVAVVLNVTPDHGDRYPDLESYARMKERLVECVRPGGVAVLNWDDERVRAMQSACRGRVWWLCTAGGQPPGSGARLENDRLVPFGEAAGLGTLELAHPRLPGRHNRENAIAALLAIHALGGTRPETLLDAYRAFQGLPHRLEWAGEVDGVRYINDSKATNDDSAATALRAMDRPVILLLGGRDKGGGYAGVLAASKPNVRSVIAFGEARDIIHKALAGPLPVDVCKSFHEALPEARRQARPGDTVLLAPACSSFDEFTDYKARGEAFKKWVRALGASTSRKPGGRA